MFPPNLRVRAHGNVREAETVRVGCRCGFRGAAGGHVVKAVLDVPKFRNWRRASIARCASATCAGVILSEGKERSAIMESTEA